MKARLLALVLALGSGLGFSACVEDGVVEEGERCDYFCSGFSCNFHCEGDVLFYCDTNNRWRLEQDCAAEGLECGADDPDSVDGTFTCLIPDP